jgi:hypothetical protein
VLTLHTFGDSILDCAHYNPQRLSPGRLLVKNDDGLFPEFRGRDLLSRGPARLAHHATDGATVEDLPRQARGLVVEGPSIAILTIGGNDLLTSLLTDDRTGVDIFARRLDAFLEALPIRPVLVGNVYDPTFGDDAWNVFGVDPVLGRINHARVNAVLADLGRKYGGVVDIHGHFLTGSPQWYVSTIEPSLVGASEVRRCFEKAIDAVRL